MKNRKIQHHPYSIVSTDFTDAGDSIIMNVDTTDVASLSLAAGQNVTWDYTILSPNKVDSIIFHKPANTPGAQYFASISNMALQPESDQPFYLYINKTTDKVEGVGIWADIQGNVIHPSYTDKPIFLKFPLEYNKTHIDSSFLTDIINMGPGMYGKIEMIQKFDVTYDATGTIKLPNNKTYKCVREKRIEINITNVYGGVTSNGPWTIIQASKDTSYTYNFYAKTKKWNVASVKVNNFTNNIIKEVQYLKE